MHGAIGARLGAMMFLQFFVWGAWYVTIGNFMVAQGMADLTHWPYTVNPIAAIIAPFFLGLVADRFFATEKVLGVLHLLGGAVMFLVPGAAGSPQLFVALLLLYNMCYMPTLALANSLAFHNIENQERQFPIIRVFGTIGWIAAGLFIGFVLGEFSGDELPDRTPLPLYAAAVASLLLGSTALRCRIRRRQQRVSACPWAASSAWMPCGSWAAAPSPFSSPALSDLHSAGGLLQLCADLCGQCGVRPRRQQCRG